MRLISPNGVVVSVSEEKGARLLDDGYRRVPEATPEPVGKPTPTPRRRSPKKATEGASSS